MPRLIRPELPPDVEAAVSFMGSRAQAEIVRGLELLGPSTIGQLQAVLAIGRPSLNRHLDALGEAGLVATDPPEGMRHGRDVTYSVQKAKVRGLVQAYTDFIEGR